MPKYIILNGTFEDRRDVVVVSDEDGSARVFKDCTVAKEWAEDHLNFWYMVVNVL